jgi:hypothetical protein
MASPSLGLAWLGGRISDGLDLQDLGSAEGGDFDGQHRSSHFIPPARNCLSGFEAWTVAINVERDDTSGMDPDNLRGQMTLGVVGAHDCLGHPRISRK